MFKIIGGDSREYGPVTAELVCTWIRQNRANGQTLVKPEGSADWLPLAQLPEFAAALAERAAPPPPPPGEYPPLSGDFRQAAPASPDGELPTRSTGSGDFQILEALSRGWEIVRSRFWLTVGASTTVCAILMIGSVIPGVNHAFSFLLTQVFYGGLFWLMLRVSRGEQAVFPDVFGGFSRAFGQLALLTLVIAAATFALLALAAAPFLVALFNMGGLSLLKAFLTNLMQGNPEALAGIDFSQLIGPVLLFPLLLLPLIYLSIAWVFAPILIVDRGLGFREALRLSRQGANRHWFGLFFLHLAFFPLAIAGALCLVVGLLVVLALYYATFTAAYESIFGDGADAPQPR